MVGQWAPYQNMDQNKRIKVQFLNATTIASVQHWIKHSPRSVSPTEFDLLVIKNQKEHNINKDDAYYERWRIKEYRSGLIKRRLLSSDEAQFRLYNISRKRWLTCW